MEAYLTSVGFLEGMGSSWPRGSLLNNDDLMFWFVIGSYSLSQRMFLNLISVNCSWIIFVLLDVDQELFV